MRNYPTYDSYRECEIDWVDEIPSDWIVKPVFSLFEEGKLKNTDGAESNVLSLSYGRIIRRDVEKNFGLLPESFNTYQILKENDIVLRLTDLQNDKRSLRVGIAKERGIITSAYLSLRSKPAINANFAYRLLHAYDLSKVFYGMGGGLRQSMKFEDFRRLPLILPPKDEQEKIAQFLDVETAKIDTLIEKQQQLIALLKEKRQAVISHAVTKGLNPDAPMRDSGVEWLGEVPAHWEVKKIWQLYTESALRANSDVELEFPVLSVSIHHGISDKELDESELDRKVQRSDDRSLYKVVGENYLVYNMMRAWQGAFGASKGDGLVSPAYVVCNPKKGTNSKFFERCLRTERAIVTLKSLSRGITDFRLRLYWDEFRTIQLPVPPSEEMEKILEYASRVDSSTDKLVIMSNHQIDLLIEKRAALISAAVTGKIDVRNWKPESDISVA